jgi:hypothetical protein
MLPQLVAAAVVGALSPVAALSTIMLLSSRRPVANTVACLVGWTLVLLLLAAGLLALLSGHDGASGTSAKASVELVVGIMLLCVALRNLLGERHPLAQPTADTPVWMTRLEHVSPGRALLIGMVLIAISPADLAAYFSALQALIGDDSGDATRAVIWVLLVLAIDSCILLPLGIYLMFPRRADRLLAGGKTWLIGHQRAVAGGSAGVFGALLLGQGIVALA